MRNNKIDVEGVEAWDKLPGGRFGSVPLDRPSLQNFFVSEVSTCV